MEPPVLGLLKFGKLEHLLSFQNDGLMFMNTPEFFKQYDSNSIISDPNEGLIAVFQKDKAIITIGDFRIDQYNGLAGAIYIRKENDKKRNLYCMYALKDFGVKPIIDNRCLGFGDHVLCITNGAKFKKRLLAAAKKYKVSLHADLVEYVPGDYHGDVGIFKKYNNYEYQNEYRIVISPGTNGPFRFYLGNMQDITTICKSSDLQGKIEYTMIK
ncbi:MAG: hypothetical protein JXA16_12475 [Bacteroidales bacterium]|nr:hypothetical protein [Bacteroidales bacterium]